MNNKAKLRFRFLILLPIPVFLLSLFVGPSDVISYRDAADWMVGFLGIHVPGGNGQAEMVRLIMAQVRLPRILLSFMVGGALSVTGISLQALFRNPLVSSYILGLQSGSAFGAALALGSGWLPVQPAAFGFGLTAVGTSSFLARKNGVVSGVTLILSGIIVTGIFTALLTIVQFITDPFKLQTIVHWIMGNLHTASWDKIKATWYMMGIGITGLYMLRWRMNVLALGDDETRAVGLNPEVQKAFVLIFSSLAAAAAVSVAGVISMVGLVIPHMVRMLIGADNKAGVPVCFTFGGSFLLLVDNVSRAATSYEIPIGIFTTLIGGPFFIFLLKKNQVGWEI